MFGTHGAKAMYDELVTAIGKKANSSDLTSHTSDTNIHVTTAERTAWNNKANDNEVVKKTDITTTIDSSSTDSEIATAKAVNDLLQTESPGNLTIPLNEDLNNLIYNRTRVWMHSQTVQIATFTNMPSGRFTECAVIFIPYENATSDFGEQIFVGNNNRIFIRNKVQTTWTAWQKICTTSVAEVPVTNIAPADTTTFINFKGNSNCNYCVKNGICYVSLWGVKIASTGGTIKPGVILPKCANNRAGVLMTGTGDATEHAFAFIIDTGELCFDVKDANTVLYGSFSYPVSES